MSLESVCFAVQLVIGEASWAEINLEFSQSIGAQYLAEYRARQEGEGVPRQAPKLEIGLLKCHRYTRGSILSRIHYPQRAISRCVSQG